MGNKTMPGNKYWNRESGPDIDFAKSTQPIVKNARIICLAKPNDPDNDLLYRGELPFGAKFLAVGACLEDFNVEKLLEHCGGPPNVLFVSHPDSRGPLIELLDAFPTVEWVHARSAGIDFIVSNELATRKGVIVTNAKGQFSSTLAEYTMMSCSYFAKDIPRLLRQKKEKNWVKYDVLELRGSTIGVIGYGDIGKACAKLAKAYGMKVQALRRKPKLSVDDPYCDVVYGDDSDSLNTLMATSDYIVVSAPLTNKTKGMIGSEVLKHAKKDTVIINVGRGPIIDEDALIECLVGRRIKGAALDVQSIEPLPADSLLWDLDNVLLSPHNMDQTSTFLSEATAFFININLCLFSRDEELLNIVDVEAGY
eukprot:CAMPEP_0194390062 /NCGR_PEP_ID=MMETSP0174-20130528/107800_1 /TAXON_ID=216777 /ORGANISM="Proboscia alata, Strain PI-D3" /LENGTH=365 /DNA_ID=CAMNT_0039182997 /DNA_START=8 /DNA_END=1105 /DNA_ORIENTATION=+